jgi:PAS domain S-box-containing protein
MANGEWSFVVAGLLRSSYEPYTKKKRRRMKIQDDSERLIGQIEQLQQRIEVKLDRRSTAGPGPSRAEALEELKISMEELRVASEELRRQADELARERQRYLDLFNFAPQAYLVTDDSGTIEEANQAAVRLFNCPQHVLLKKPLVLFVPADERDAFRSRLAEVRVEGREKLDNWRIKIRPRLGPDIVAVATVGAIRDPLSRLIGLRWLLQAMSAD